MIIEAVNVGLLLFFSIIDIKFKEIPDNLTIGYIFVNIFIPLPFIFGKGQNEILLVCVGIIAGALIGWFVCWVFYLAKHWGGADGKIIIGASIAAISFIGKFYLTLLILTITYFFIMKYTKAKFPQPLVPVIFLAYLASLV